MIINRFQPKRSREWDNKDLSRPFFTLTENNRTELCMRLSRSKDEANTMDKDDENGGVMEITELVEMYQEPQNRLKAVSTHCLETPGQRPNETLKELENDPSYVPSTEHSFIGACTPNEQSEAVCLDGEHPQRAGYELQDDVSSIFSDQESDMREREILQEALLQLKRENPFGFADTCSECSDDLSESDRRSDSCFSRTQTPQELNAVQNNGHETPTKASEREISQRATELGETSCQDAVKPEHRNQLHILRRIFQSPTSERDARAEKHLGVPKINDGFCGSDSSDSGYISDIAVLARENEKLSEIIDHLHMQAPSYEDDGGLELMDRYVGKQQYDIVESERFELESKLREKDRRIREQERTAEEDKYEHEEECTILNHSLKKAERKVKEKTKELEHCEAKMKEAMTKHFKQVGNLERELESARRENFKLEETILVLQKHNADFEREMQGMKQHIVKLEAHEEQLDERYRRDVGQLEEYLEMESQEKNKLKQTVDALRQELLQTKTMMQLKEAAKHVVEEHEMDSKLKTENEKFGVLGRQMPTTPTSCVVDAGAHVLEETLLTESGGTQEGIGHKPDIEKRIQEEQQRRAKLEEENQAMSTALKGLLSGDHSRLQTLFSDDTFSKLDVKSIQRKFSETLKELNEVQSKNEEAEAEVKHLKRKSERLEKDVAQMRKLEGKNEELHVELERANRKLREIQRAAGNTREEMQEMTETMRRLKDDNLAYKDETERLKVKIKHTEELLTEAKTRVAKSLEEEKLAALHELKTKQEEAERRNKRLELENDTLRQDLQKTDQKIHASEEKFATERSELITEHTKELEDMKEKCALKQKELNRTAKTVREVTEEWEKMLRETVSRNEETLQKLREEKRQVQEELRRKTQDMDRQLKLCKCKLEQPSHDREENCPRDSGEKTMQHVESYVQQKPQNRGTTEMVDNVQAEHRNIAKYSPGADTHAKEEQADQIQALSRKHELEMKELRERLNNESKEERERLKMELTRSLVMKSVILESRIESLVVQKVQEQKQRNRRQVVQHERDKEQYNITIRRLKDKIRMYEAEWRALEEEKGELEVTVSSLRNELHSSKEEANERREREAKKMEEEFEMEKQKLQEILEKRNERTKEKMEEEYRRKATSERRGYEGEIRQLTAAVMLLKEQVGVRDPECKACSKHDTSEPESSTKDARIIKELEQEHERKVRKETENMSDTLESLRREIELLKAHRQQLQTGVYNRRENNNIGLQHSYPMKVDTTQFLLGSENESHQQVHHERSVLKEKTRELEIEVERLHQEMNQQEARSRREHVHMRRRFQSEKEEIEEESRREINKWRAEMSVLATRANLRRVQTTFDGGRIPTKRNNDAFLKNHVTYQTSSR